MAPKKVKAIEFKEDGTAILNLQADEATVIGSTLCVLE